jgi:anhydro-N-acetylmuramic acid kinase
MDEWYRRHHAKLDMDGYDAGGTWAAGGRCDTALLNRWLSDPYFTKAPPKSTGREYFNLDWLEHIGASSVGPSASAQDVQATLAELTACSVAQSIATAMSTPQFVPVCGGGRLNTHLMARIEANLVELGHDCEIEATEHWGVDGDALEASAFAWLAYRRVCNLTGNLSAATGANGKRILGAIYPP